MSSEQQILGATKKWLRTVVIAHNFCPFAAREYQRDSIVYSVCTALTLEAGLSAFLSLCLRLDNDKNSETALLIFPAGYHTFDDYLSLLAAAEDALVMGGYEGVYQVASFHPQYCFAGAREHDAANYTNRSPWPMLHLLRESSVETALAQHPNVDAIPDDNIQRAHRLGYAEMAATLQGYFDA